MFKKIWKDPVGSKIIAAIILALVAIIYAKIISLIENISFIQALQGIYEIKIRLVYIIVIVIIFFFFRKIYINNKINPPTKQEELKKFNRIENPEEGILYRWRVYFYLGTPHISDLNAYCKKHEGSPIRFMNNRCSFYDCENHRNRIEINMIQNQIESMLLDQWENLNEESN